MLALSIASRNFEGCEVYPVGWAWRLMEEMRLHVRMTIAVAFFGAVVAARGQALPSAPGAPCADGVAGCAAAPASPKSPAKEFPFPGETPSSSDQPAADAPSVAPTPTTKPAPFAYPGDPAASPDAAAPAKKPAPFAYPGDPDAKADPNASSSSSSSSSSGSSGDADDPNAPDNPGPLSDAGSSGDSTKPGHSRRRKLDKVEAQTPDSREAEDLTVAAFYTNDGNYAAAYARAKDAVQYKPDDVYAHFALAEAAYKLGKRDEARTEYTQVLKLDPIPKQEKASQKALAELASAKK
jgi:hypothetical protein